MLVAMTAGPVIFVVAVLSALGKTRVGRPIVAVLLVPFGAALWLYERWYGWRYRRNVEASRRRAGRREQRRATS